MESSTCREFISRAIHEEKQSLNTNHVAAGQPLVIQNYTDVSIVFGLSKWPLTTSCIGRIDQKKSRNCQITKHFDI